MVPLVSLAIRQFILLHHLEILMLLHQLVMWSMFVSAVVALAERELVVVEVLVDM